MPDTEATLDQRLHAIAGRWQNPGHVVFEPRIEVVRTDIYEVFSGGHFLVHHVDVGSRHTGWHAVEAGGLTFIDSSGFGGADTRP